MLRDREERDDRLMTNPAVATRARGGEQHAALAAHRAAGEVDPGQPMDGRGDGFECGIRWWLAEQVPAPAQRASTGAIREQRAQRRCSSTSDGTPTASRSRIIGSSITSTAASCPAGRTIWNDGSCQVWAVLISKDRRNFAIQGSGVQPGDVLRFYSTDGHDPREWTDTVDETGNFLSAIDHGRRGGTALFSVTAPGCKVTLSYDFGRNAKGPL